jgi:hypothetical protein
MINQKQFRVGDIVRHQKKVYVVSGTKGWVHRSGWISLAREIGTVSLLVRIEEVYLIKKREEIKKNFWEIFPEGEK